jgi:hypothetical protein
MPRHYLAAVTFSRYGSLPSTEEKTMRAILTASLAAGVIGLCTAALAAVPASVAVNQNASPLVQPAQYGGGYGGEHHHYCRPYWHWACHYGECRCYRD